MKKWKAKKAYCQHGHKHDSISEAKRCDELHIMLAAGEIEDLLVWPQFWFVINGRQVKHDNGRRAGITLDFYYKMPDGKEVCEDVKPVAKIAISRDWPLRKAIFKSLYPEVELRETQPSNSRKPIGKDR